MRIMFSLLLLGLGLGVMSATVILESYYYPGVIGNNLGILGRHMWLLGLSGGIGAIILSKNKSVYIKLILAYLLINYLAALIVLNLEKQLLVAFSNTQSLYIYFHIDTFFIKNALDLWGYLIGLLILLGLFIDYPQLLSVLKWFVVSTKIVWDSWSKWVDWINSKHVQLKLARIFIYWPPIFVVVLILIALGTQTFIIFKLPLMIWYIGGIYLVGGIIWSPQKLSVLYQLCSILVATALFLILFNQIYGLQLGTIIALALSVHLSLLLVWINYPQK